jgi:hypothetical protein
LAPSLIPLPLALPIEFRPRGIVLEQLRPVIRMFRAPLLRALQTHLSIHRIGGDLPPMVIVTTPSLADWIAAGGLSRLELGWLKRTLAIAANPFSHEPVLACHGIRLPDSSWHPAAKFRNSCRVCTASSPLGRFF